MSKSNRVSLHGNRAYLTDDDMLTGKGGVASGGVNKPWIAIPGSPDRVAVFDDFLISHAGDADAAGLHFRYAQGDTGADSTVTIPAVTNGVARITPTATAVSSIAGTVVVINGETAMWKVNQGKGAGAGSLRMAARVKKASYNTGEHGIFVGFTDTVSAEMPFHDTGGTADKAAASNGFGIGWNLGGDTGWMGFAVDGNTVQETALTTTAPTANAYVVLEMEAHRSPSDTGGDVTFYVDGIPKGRINNPCNVSTGLTPVVAIYDTGGAAVTDIDWIAVSAPRDTGT